MARIASAVGVKYLVVAGVSNWGAYGIVAALSRLSGQMLLHGAAEERRLVEACVEAGARRGSTPRPGPPRRGLAAQGPARVGRPLRRRRLRAEERGAPMQPAGD